MASEKEGNGEKILLLVSGGPDSAALARLVESQREEGDEPIHAIYLKTGEPSDEKEIEAADRILAEIGGQLEIIDIQDAVRALGGNRLLIHSHAALMPFGNVVALSLATAYAFQIGATQIALGLHRDDARENPEYTAEFVSRIEDLAQFGHGSRAPRLVLPFIEMPKSEVIRRSLELGVDHAHTWSCIRHGDRHCGLCGACRARRRAFDAIDAVDPTEYGVEPPALESVDPGEAAGVS